MLKIYCQHGVPSNLDDVMTPNSIWFCSAHPVHWTSSDLMAMQPQLWEYSGPLLLPGLHWPPARYRVFSPCSRTFCLSVGEEHCLKLCPTCMSLLVENYQMWWKVTLSLVWKDAEDWAWLSNIKNKYYTVGCMSRCFWKEEQVNDKDK